MTAARGRPYRFGFVMEQTLGHVTHYKNMRATIDHERDVEASWYPLAFPSRAGLETLPPLRGNWSARSSLRARQTLARDGAQDRYDALFFHTQVTTLLSMGLMRRVPTVISLDATPLNYDAVGAAYGHHPAGGAVEGLKRRLVGRALREARALVAWSDWARRSLVDDYGIAPDRITVVAPGVDLALWPQPGSRPRPDEGPLRILFVGGDFARKGGETLLQAFAGLRGRRALELHLVTKAPVVPAPGVHVYRDLAPNGDALRELYATADIFALPTLADCFSLASIEAMACGLPVVSCPVGGIPEIVRQGETGLLIPPGDVGALRAAIAGLVNDPTRRRDMGARGRVRAEQEYDSAANARRILAIMRDLCRGRGGG